MITDAVLETHDRIVGKIYNDAKRTRDDLLSDQRKLTNKTLTSFIKLGRKLLKVHGNGGSLSEVIQNREALEEMMDTASILTKKLQSDPLGYVLSGHNKLRQYVKRMLEGITFEGSKSVQPLIKAINVLKQINGSDKQLDHPLPVNSANPKWRKRLGESPEKKLWETAVLFTIRDLLRSRDIWVHLLAAIIIYWNTKHLGLIIQSMKQRGYKITPEQIAHLSPLGWEHIILTGFYK